MICIPQLAENKQKKPAQNFSDYQFPLPLPSQKLGVVLYCFDRHNVLSKDEGSRRAFKQMPL
jgi:hypothetical protein